MSIKHHARVTEMTFPFNVQCYTSKFITVNSKYELLKGKLSIILIKWQVKIAEQQSYSPRSNNYDVCRAAALCILNVLDVFVLKSIYYIQILNIIW